MPSPFPGMDPYLEDRFKWPDLHARLIYLISDALSDQILPKYAAVIGEYVKVAHVPRQIIPDVNITQASDTVLTRNPSSLVADAPQTYLLNDEDERITYVEIVEAASGDVVTVIELLSPSNKFGEGREQYLAKQKALLRTAANLVEIDLLGYGRNTVLARHVHDIKPSEWRYIISTSRADKRYKLEYYAIPLSERLPRCQIPLRSPDPDAVLDLQAIFTHAYNRAGLARRIDYDEPPQISLNAKELQWIEDVLIEKGVRA